VGWCYRIVIATMDYIVVEGDLFQSFLTMLPALQDGRSALTVIIMLGLSAP